MKICCPTYWYPEYKGDIHATYVHDINRHIAKKGNEIIVITPNFQGKSKKKEEWDKVKVVRFNLNVPSELTYGKIAQGGKKSRLSALSAIRKLWTMFLYMAKTFFYTYRVCRSKDNRDGRIDVIHSHWAIPSGFPAVIVSKILKIPCFITMHGGDVYYNPKEGYVYPKLWYVRPFLKYTLRNAAKLTAITEDCKQHALNAGALEKDIVVINNGADLERFSKKEKDVGIVEKYGLSENTIFSCRQLIPRKGMRFLIRAMPGILKKFPDARLLIAGDGVERPKLEKMIKGLGLTKHVFLLGWIPNDELPRYYNSCDAAVMPSLEEGFGIPAAEAMGCEKPVVSTDAGGLVEVVEDGVTGVIVKKGSSKELSEGIIKVFSDKEAAERMGKEGRKRALRLFSWDKTADDFINLYRQYSGKSRNQSKPNQTRSGKENAGKRKERNRKK